MVDAGKLRGVRVLVTRPRGQGEEQCRAIAARGGIAYHCPMLEIIPAEPPTPGWWRGYDWLIFVSTNAVRFALEAGLPKAERFKSAAIGKATAQALAEAGLRADLTAPPPYTSESLLAQEALRQVLGRRILIVQGIGGRTELADTLNARGAQVDRIELYRRAPPRPDTIAYFKRLLAQGLDAVSVSSGEGLVNLQSAAGERLGELYALPMVVVSSRLAEEARRAGFADVIVASSALDEAVVEALAARFALS